MNLSLKPKIQQENIIDGELFSFSSSGFLWFWFVSWIFTVSPQINTQSFHVLFQECVQPLELEKHWENQTSWTLYVENTKDHSKQGCQRPPKVTGKSHSSVGWLYLCHSRFCGLWFQKYWWTHLPMWWIHRLESLQLFASVLTHCLSPCLHWQAKQVVPFVPFFLQLCVCTKTSIIDPFSFSSLD